MVCLQGLNHNIGKMCHVKLKFIFSEKAAKFCKISTLLLTGTTEDKKMVEIFQNFVAFPDNMKLHVYTVIK